MNPHTIYSQSTLTFLLFLDVTPPLTLTDLTFKGSLALPITIQVRSWPSDSADHFPDTLDLVQGSKI